MGGEIHVESIKGQGSAFIFTINCEKLTAQEKLALEAKTEPETSLLSPTSIPPSTPQQQITTLNLPWLAGHSVLVVEDNLVNQKTLKAILEKEKIHCRFAADGQEALNILNEEKQTNPPAIILMDIQMSIMDGLEATQRIRQKEADKKLSRIPIIGLSGNALSGDAEKALKAGMDDYLTKPYKREVLLEKIQRLLTQQQTLSPAVSNAVMLAPVPTPTVPALSAAPPIGAAQAWASASFLNQHLPAAVAQGAIAKGSETTAPSAAPVPNNVTKPNSGKNLSVS